MNLSLSNTLGRRMALASLDPDAKGYIDAVVAAGATVSGGQKSAINTFVKTGKADGWYSSLKRLYLPIWAAAAPNAICMTSLTSGTFVGGVTHGAGFVQGDGTTQRFNSGATPGSLGMGAGNWMIGALINLASTIHNSSHVSSFVSTSQMLDLNSFGFSNGIRSRGFPIGTIAQIDQDLVSQTGVVLATHQGAATARRIYQQKASTLATANGATGEAGTLPNVDLSFMADSRGVNFTDARYGAFFAGASYDDDAARAYVANLKTLWETCTGLTLP